MGSSIISAWQRSKNLNQIRLHVVENSISKINNIKKINKNIKISRDVPDDWNGEFIIFAIKPQDFKNLAKVIVNKNICYKNIISIMAGITVKKITASLNNTVGVTRVMPNLAVEINLGVSCIYHSKKINLNSKNKINKLFSIVGSVYLIKEEKLLESVTAISGSGPAYFFLFLRIFENITIELGFNKKTSKKLVYDTIEGAFELAKKKSNIKNLISSVTSKQGTTEAALKILEKKNAGLYTLMSHAIHAAKERANEISKLV